MQLMVVPFTDMGRLKEKQVHGVGVESRVSLSHAEFEGDG